MAIRACHPLMVRIIPLQSIPSGFSPRDTGNGAVSLTDIGLNMSLNRHVGAKIIHPRARVAAIVNLRSLSPFQLDDEILPSSHTDPPTMSSG